MANRILIAVSVLMLLASQRSPANPFRNPLYCAVTNDAGFGNEIFVTGSHPLAGSWNPVLGAKLTWNPGNVWTGRVALPAGTVLEYKPVVVPNSYTGLCNPANWQYLPPGDGNHRTGAVAVAPPAPYSGKQIRYHSGLTNVLLIYSLDGSAFTALGMAVAGAGRFPGEFVHTLELPGSTGAAIEFVFSGQSGTNTVYDHAPHAGYGTAPAHNYFTTLDSFYVQDGDVFNYRPPATLSAPVVLVSNAVSTFSPSPSRTMKIYLPRGYAQNTWKRYPVMYMHDGENVMPPYTGLGQWKADEIATREISQGRMREAIIVSLNSTANRTREYLPPEDSSGGQGFGDVYARFLIHDVKAKIDAEFRTLTNQVNTMTAGSSSGGLISTYLGWSTNVFGKIGSFSPAYLISPNFNARIASEAKKPLRIYTDMGTEGYPENALVPDYWVVLDHLLRDGYVQNDDLLSWLACGALHNEAAWSERLPVCFRFLLNVWDEPSYLAAERSLPSLKLSAPAGNAFDILLNGLGGWTYNLEQSSFLGGWVPVTNTMVEKPWGPASFSNLTPFFTFAAFRVSMTNL